MTERDAFRPFEIGLHIVDAVRKLHPDRFEWTKPESGSHCYFDTLAGTDKIRKRLCDGSSVSEIIKGFQEELSGFMEMRKNYLLYNRQAPT